MGVGHLIVLTWPPHFHHKLRHYVVPYIIPCVVFQSLGRSAMQSAQRVWRRVIWLYSMLHLVEQGDPDAFGAWPVGQGDPVAFNAALFGQGDPVAFDAALFGPQVRQQLTPPPLPQPEMWFSYANIGYMAEVRRGLDEKAPPMSL
jgi:hypothetical protein